MLKISYALVVMGYLQPFCRNLLWKCVPQLKITKNSLKQHILSVQGCSRSSPLTPLWSLSPVLVMISSMSVPICNGFHSIRANSGKKHILSGVPLFHAAVRWEPPHPGTQNFITLN